jgi:hypothetical protein
VSTEDASSARDSATFTVAYESLVQRFAAESFADERARARAEFERRTGAFAPEDAWFEARSRAFIDDALTRRALLSALEPELPDEVRAWVPAFGRAHRGLFETVDGGDDEALIVRDVWSGIELVVTDADESTSLALDAARGLFDARAIGRDDPLCVAILPGAVFHAEEATDALQKVVLAAKKRGLSTSAALDALLRMEHKWRTLSRMKPGYAYREDSLPSA